MLGVGVLAFAVRLSPVLAGGGLRGLGNYDDSVYYAAADSLSFGRLPYRDFVLLHPPGISLILLPFAVLGRMTSDPVGMLVARLAFMALGAVNAVLCVRVAARWGLAAGLLAGCFYAGSLPAITAERSTLLEPIGSTMLLLALLLLLRAGPTSPRIELLAGAALGFAPCIKIWYVVPWAVVVLWQVASNRPKSAWRTVWGGLIPLALIWIPFLVLTGRRMIDMVIVQQLLRPPATTSRLARLPKLLGVARIVPDHTFARYIAIAVGLALILAAVLCWQARQARLVVLLLVAGFALLLESPVYFEHYPIVLAAPAALTAGIGLGPLVRATAGWRRRAGQGVMVLALLAVGASAVLSARLPANREFPGTKLARALPERGCVIADDDAALIELNRFSEDLRQGCHVEVDVTGLTYGVYARHHPDGRPVSRRSNVDWQTFLRSYLTSGSAFILVRQTGTGLSRDTEGFLAQAPVIGRANGFTLRGVRTGT